MHIDCPECGENNDLDCDDLPERACDDNENYECKLCGHVFSIGWYAVAEIRDKYIDV
jgi:hypothetical protein